MKIGPYEVLGELGRGGMGVVYRVRTPEGREAALKLILDTNAERFARFERERRLQGALGEEQGFVGLLAAGRTSGAAWLLMPFVPGGTLRDRLHRGPLGVEETIALGIELASALGRAHEKGIVHRDVKPENILFAASGPPGSRTPRPLIADLGLAKHFDRAAPGASVSSSLTREGAFRGTLGYMAPEQTSDSASAGPPADVFALGAVLHECLAGRPVFAGENIFEVLASVSAGTVTPIERPDVPRWLEAVLRRALALEPGDRFATGADLARALRGREEARPRRPGWAPFALLGLVGALLGAGLLLGRGTPAPGPDRATPEKPPARETPPTREIQAVVATPDSTTAPALSADKIVHLAQDALYRSDWDGAIALASRAIEVDPGFALAWLARGTARHAKADLDSLADFVRATELDPKNAKAWSGRAAAHNAREDWDEAIADASKAIELDPRLGPAWENRAEGRLKKGDWDGTISDATRAIELTPDSATAWDSRSAARINKGDLEGAIADASKALELDPEAAGAWANRAAARGNQGDADGAIADCTRAIELDPKLPWVWMTRANERSKKADWAGTRADTSKAIELDPKGANAWILRGVARYNLDDPGAVADIEHGLELRPDGPEAEQARGLLRQIKGGAPR